MKLTLNIELQKLNEEQLNLLAKITDQQIFPLIKEPFFDKDFLKKYPEIAKHSIARSVFKDIFKSPVGVICKEKEVEVLPQFLKDRAIIEYSDKDGRVPYISTHSSDKEWQFYKETKEEN